MAKKRKSIRHYKRHSRRLRKMTLLKAGKWFIALFPQAMDAYDAWKSGGPRAAGNKLVRNFSGWDRDSHSFNAMDLADGYIPFIGAWGFGKVASRVLR